MNREFSEWEELRAEIEKKKKTVQKPEEVLRDIKLVEKPRFNETDIKVIEIIINEKALTLKSLREKIAKSRISIYHSIKKLERFGILKKDKRVVRLLDNDLVNSISALINGNFNLNYITGERLSVMISLLERRSIDMIANDLGISESSVYKYLDELDEFVEKSDGFYRIRDDRELINFLRTINEILGEIFVEYRYKDEFLIKSRRELGYELTAFSRFPEFGIEFNDNYNYYSSKRNLKIEEIFVHSLRFSKNRDMMANCIRFLLRNSRSIDLVKVEECAIRFNVLDLWFDMVAYLSGKNVLMGEIFPTDNREFLEDSGDIFHNLEEINSLTVEEKFFRNSIHREPNRLLLCEDILKSNPINAINWNLLYEMYVNERELNLPWNILINRLTILENRIKVRIPIRNKLYRYFLRNSILTLLKTETTIEDIRDKLEIPEYRIRNLLNKLVREGVVERLDTKPISFRVL